MKKLLYIFFLVSFLFMCFSKETNNASRITSGTFIENKSYRKFSDIKNSQNCDFKDSKYGSNSNNNVSSFLPAYFWDAKMITW